MSNENVIQSLCGVVDAAMSSGWAEGVNGGVLAPQIEAQVRPDSRFAEVYHDGEAWNVILHNSFEAGPNAGEQEFKTLGEAEKYIREFTQSGKVIY